MTSCFFSGLSIAVVVAVIVVVENYSDHAFPVG